MVDTEKDIQDAEFEETEETEEEAAVEDAVEVEEEEPTNPVGDAPVLAPVEAPTIEAPVATTAAPIAPSKNPEGDIVLSGDAFAALMARLNKLEDDSRLLNQVQDRNTIQKIERLRAEGKLVKSVKVRKIGEKYVIGWQSLQDEVYQDENGRLVEKQSVKIFFHDQSDKVFTMRQWASAGEYIPFEVTGETKDADGNLFFKTVGPDGLVLNLNATFIN